MGAIELKMHQEKIKQKWANKEQITIPRRSDINPVGDVIGNTTLYRFQQSNYEDFLHKYQNLVREQDRNNPKYDYFGKGWDRRTNAYHVSY